MIPTLGFAGYSGSGKSTLIEKLIPVLKRRGVRVAIVKHDAHGFEIDHEGKDSYRFTAAGAEQVVLSSPDKTACVEQRGETLSELLAMVHDVDLILVEGFKHEVPRQIGICRKACGKPLPHEAERYLAVVTDMGEIAGAKRRFGLEDIEEIAEFIMKNMEDFTHFNEQGRAKMVDVGAKAETRRTATAFARVLVSEETFALIKTGGMKKGDVLTVAQVAGVMGAKRTPDLIPMCHPIIVDGIDLSLELKEEDCAVEIRATVSCAGRTGVEMEALTAASTAALTVYDMCKAVQKDIVITDLCLLEKTGGVHGDYHRKDMK